ncbi:hypothetical protein N431DRAFT_320955 [Stipitochalara longipes BDJ]|nr:hypothetical protein N431DRAFT_320955 [Stipitochalara longipes BDJ]
MSTHNPISTFVGPQSARDPDDDFGLNNSHFPATPFDSNLLSPYNPSQTISNSASPSNNIGSTPGDSEYSNYQPSEFSDIEDPFFGVNFDAGVGRIDSGLSNIGFHAADLNRPLPDLPAQTQPPSATFTNSTYPLSPIHSSSPNSPYNKGLVNDTKGVATITQHELTTDLHNLRYQNGSTLPPTQPTTLQLTPDLSSSSHTSAEGIEPGTVSRPDDSAANMASQWKRVQQQDRPNGSDPQSSGQYNPGNQFNGQLQPPQGAAPPIMRSEEGQWKSDETTGQAGLGPEARRELSNAEIPTLDEAEERRRINGKNLDIVEWRSQAGGSDAGDELPPRFNHNPFQQTHSQLPHEDENSEIPPVDDAVSIHENHPIPGQVYYDLSNLNITESDKNLMKLPRHWYDPPTIPEITTTSHQPLTSNEAIMRYKQASDAVSIASRAATWGTRRRRLSEPSLSDYDAVIDGSFLKRLSISKSREGERRSSNFFDQGLDRLDRLANIVRMRSDSKLKRVRSSNNMPEERPNLPQGRHNSAGTLAPSRSGSLKKGPPSINTALAAMAGPLAAVGTAHTRKGSIGGNPTSPQSPAEHLTVRKGWPHRGRSKSELNPRDRETGLVGLMRAQGGPPVVNLATGAPEVEDRRPERQQHEDRDLDEDDDDDEDQADEGDMDVEIEKDPIIPNYEGFKAHVLRLNTEMDPKNKWLVSRIAHQQEIRYKNLLDLRVKHSQAILSKTCSAGPFCVAQNGGATSADGKGQASSDGPLQLVTDFNSDNDSNPGEGALNDETFPQGVPMPPTRNLPAEFECQLCFKAKKFQKPSDWTKHVHEDVQPFTCTYEKCKEPKSFKRKADWVRHENERHRHLEWWICQYEDCRHPCYRKDNFLQHLVREHKLPEPKQKTKAAIKKARLTEPAWMMLEQCHHETTSRPQDEPCKFCGKTFPTWKKLTVHLAKHMEHISLPVLRLVEQKVVDANTIISPVENIISPVTPSDAMTKMESSASPFNMMNVTPHIPAGAQFVTTGYEQPNYFSTAGSGYSNLDSTMNFQPTTTMYPNTFPIQQPTFSSLGSNGMHTMNNTRSYEMMDNGFVQPKIEQPGPYRQPMANAYTNVVQNQSYNMHHQSAPYSMPQNLNGAPAVSGYQNPNILGISQAPFPFNPMAVDSESNFQQQQTPMTRPHGSVSSYSQGHSPPVPYYPQ